MDRPPPGHVEDLATLAKLDEEVLLKELKVRYDNNNIYVSIMPNFLHSPVNALGNCNVRFLLGNLGIS